LVRTDHYSLKYLLDQRLSTIPQHQWLSKLVGFDFAVEYRSGRLNAAADALSCRDSESSSDDAAELHAISGPSFDLLDDIRAATSTDEEAARLLDGGLDAPWHTDAGLLLHGKRIFVPAQHDLRQRVLSLVHSAGHEGVQKTLQRLRADFYFPHDMRLVQEFVRAYPTCQRNKTST
jgi:hypothetical protein